MHIVLFIITVIAAIGYALLISHIYSGWEDTPLWKAPNGYMPVTKVSIVIAARNEADHIERCIRSILENQYPNHLMEVILVDDHSTDDTASLARSIDDERLIVVSNPRTGKKAALHCAISRSTGTIIVQTDADSFVPNQWLLSVVSYYEMSKARLIAAPIQYLVDKSTIQRFQYLDALNNMAVTANGITRGTYYMANGANLTYEKSLYEEVGGFGEASGPASGDDMHMIQQAALLSPEKVRFLKSQNATVKTKAESSWVALHDQRKRWSTKTKSYSHKGIIKIQVYVFGFVMLMLLDLVVAPWGSGLSLFGFIFGMMIKGSVDHLYLMRVADFFSIKDKSRHFLIASVIYLVYILISGWWAISPSSYHWKGRKVS